MKLSVVFFLLIGGFHSGAKAEAWKPEWSKDFMACWQKYGANSKIPELTRAAKDVGPGKEWCPEGGALDEPSQVGLFYLAAFKKMAFFESSYNEKLVDGAGTNGAAIGLLQIGVGDASEQYKCKDLAGAAIKTQQQLQIARNNICCAIQIINVTGTSPDFKPDDRQYVSKGTRGLLGNFWQPMRETVTGRTNNAANRRQVRDYVNKACQSISSGYSRGDELTADEFNLAVGKDSPSSLKNGDGQN